MANLRFFILCAALACCPRLAHAQRPSATSSASSPDPRVKFKDGERYLRDLSAALDLPRDSICKELDLYDCYSDAFRIVLGGVEPYSIRIVEPNASASLTTPIALDRVALRVCTARVSEDEKAPEKAVLYHPVKKPDSKWKRETAQGLYDVLLRRSATRAEIERLTRFYNSVAAEHKGQPAQQAARDWAILGCFALATSLESIFY